MADLTHQAPTKLNKPDPVWAGLSMGELGKVVGVALLALGPISQLTAWLPQPVHVALVAAVAGGGIVQVRQRPHGRSLLAWLASAAHFRRVGGVYLWRSLTPPPAPEVPRAEWARLAPAVRFAGPPAAGVEAGR